GGHEGVGLEPLSIVAILRRDRRPLDDLALPQTGSIGTSKLALNLIFLDRTVAANTDVDLRAMSKLAQRGRRVRRRVAEGRLSALTTLYICLRLPAVSGASLSYRKATERFSAPTVLH